MSEPVEQTKGSPPEQNRPEKELPLDTRILSDAVIELNISRKNVAIYPPGHVQITQSIERAYEVLLKLFAIRTEMTFGVAKDTLFVGQDYLDRKNPVYRDFALSLNAQGIAAVTFSRGLDLAELERFHRIITTKPQDVTAAGGIARVVASMDMPHIQVVPIDYGSFHLTEEAELSHAHARPAEGVGPGLWGDFVSHLAAGTIAMPGQDRGISLKDAEQIDPAELARLLNERRLDPSLALESYDRIITSHVRVRAEQKSLTRSQSETLRSMNDLLKDLHPDLRKQFLSVTFQRTAEASPAVTEEVMGGLTDNMVLEMLQQASSEGREISPTLTGLLQKLAGTGVHAADRSAPKAAPTAGPMPDASLSPEQFQSLFDREQYESYVSGEYEDTLKRLASGQAGMAAAAGAFPIEEYLATLTDERLDYQIGRVLLGFIDEDIEDEDYGEFLKKVVSNLPELVKTEQFALLHDSFETLRLHVREKRSIAVRSMAEIALRGFKDPAFITSVVEGFMLCQSKERSRAAAHFLLALGKEALPPLFDLYAQEDAPGGKRSLFDLLCRFGNAAVDEALARLGNKRPAVVRNLVMLVRWQGDRTAASQLRPLLKHKDQSVRIEVITALLRFRDPAAVPVLRSEIRSSDPDASALAMALAGQFRVYDAVGDILGKLKKVILFESDYQENEDIIRVLGEIGDARSLPELERMARANWPLFPKSRQRMKAVLFESLERYPRSAVTTLLSIGEQTGDPRVLRACTRLKEGKSRA